MKIVVLFCRVSSSNDRQSYDRQINDLTKLANSLNYHIEGIFVEKVSGLSRTRSEKN